MKKKKILGLFGLSFIIYLILSFILVDHPFVPFIVLLIELTILAKVAKIDSNKLFGKNRNVVKPLIISVVLFAIYIFITINLLEVKRYHYSNYAISFITFTILTLFQSSCEELVYRSYFSYFLEDYNTYLVALISSVIFGLLHFTQNIIVVLFAIIIGFIFMVIDRLSENFYYSYIFHIINNIVAFNILSNGIVLDEKPIFITNNYYPSLAIYGLYLIVVLLVERKSIFNYYLKNEK